ncbi:Na(+)/H(+) antiporter subunit G [Candidatus Brocadiaceae bacterium S225]|uniref:Na(+)/H(+) antiporter subunit G n=1 Tax=Candidatus Scalindua brodae TaxID=237368 RepID=A0A0B0EGM1_9BACT|nr:MAG: Na(+)/H(+) antiporter subunit G [Candidatus Scalindua brodae]TWU31916.1 Na(+)/H(+) antiporter subunit G [Candidatus Brocadiaceae bacterium S225]
MIREWICAILLVSGALFMFVGALGVVRLPDLFTRMHAATKSASFGSVLMLCAVAVYFGEVWIIFETLLVIFFIFLTTPVGTHMIGRVGYLLGTPLWQGTVINELQGRYNMRKRVLESGLHDSATQTGNENKMDNHLNEIK